MALNFPPIDSNDGNPTDGMVWTAPNGRQWVYDETVPGWKSLAPTGNSNIVYRGGLDLTEDPSLQYTDIESGNQFAVTVGANPVDVALYPGLGGKNVQPGSVVMYDGNEWQLVSGIPYATTSAPGVVQLATVAEAEEGISDKKAITPLTGKSLFGQADTTKPGITRYATRNEAEAGVEAQAALTPYSIANLIGRLENAIDQLVPTGMIMWWADDVNIPNGWIVCNGESISSTGSTADLYQTLLGWGNTWGNGATVRVPDLRGRFIRGYNFGSGRDPADPPFGSTQNDQFEEHDHSVSGYKTLPEQGEEIFEVIIDDDYTGIERNVRTGVTGGVETRPKNMNLTPLIKL